MNADFFTSFAQFASTALSTPFPAIARSRAHDAITDCIGCIAAGRSEPLAGKLLRALPSWPQQTPQEGMAAMAFTDRMATPADAACLLYGLRMVVCRVTQEQGGKGRRRQGKARR